MYIVFIYFSAVLNRFRYHQNAYLRDIVFIFSLQFEIVSDTTRMHALETLYMCKNKTIPGRAVIKLRNVWPNSVFP